MGGGRRRKPREERRGGHFSLDVHASAVAWRETAKILQRDDFWSSLSFPFVVRLCAAYADIVLLLSALRRESHTHLVEPLVTAAVTLDPVHLQDSQHTHSVIVCFQCDTSVSNYGLQESLACQHTATCTANATNHLIPKMFIKDIMMMILWVYCHHSIFKCIINPRNAATVEILYIFNLF